VSLAALLSLVAIALHVRFVTTVGALWRDETNSVNLANLTSFREIWQFLDYDSFPILFFAVLRGWTAMFGLDNDTALRALGLLTGCAIIGVLWLNARSLGARLPVLSLALLGLNPMIIRYGDSVRGYGLGMLLILLAFRSFWRIADPAAQVTPKRVLSATCWSLLSVQCLYYNSVLLLAICCGAAAVALRARAWGRIALVVGIGAVAAVSLLPYAPMMRRMGEWTFLVSWPADYAWIWTRLCEVIGSPDPLATVIWCGLFLGALVVIIRSKVPAAALFAAVAAVVGVAVYATFLNVLNYYTQPWYYVTLAAFVACALDVVFGVSKPASALRTLRVAMAVVLLPIAAYPAWDELATRHTNIDAVAARLQPIATKQDLILMPRWECAIPFARYYHGPAEMITLPPITDHRFHRYDLVLQHMLTPDSPQPVLDRVEETLRAGHKVFVVGTLPYPTATTPIPALPPLRRTAKGRWEGPPQGRVWNFRAGQFLRAHGSAAGEIDVPLPTGTRVQSFEDLSLTVISGWKE
jgi:uncharacterized membrane protein